jgi:SAM-dependent methyltransferase
MHPTAMQNSRDFFTCYSDALRSGSAVRVIDIGSQDVNGSLRQTCPEDFSYVGVDFVAGKGVDVVLEDPYTLPFDTESADVVVSSSCFEHSELFWVLFLEILRILKPAGLFYLNVPANGDFHRFPVDCWRFYPDSGRALITWAKRNGFPSLLLESYTSTQIGDEWNDFVAVFLKDERHCARFPDRILNKKEAYNNGIVLGRDEILKFSKMPEDKKKMALISQVLANRIKLT